MKKAFLFDFDGTITLRDTSELVLRRYASSEWEIFDAMMDSGEISLEECMKRQFQLVKEGPETILSFLDEQIQIRKGFSEIISKLARTDAEIAIVSAGLDFVIRHQMERLGLDGKIRIICGKTSFDGHIHFDFPAIENPAAADFKQDAVMKYQQSGHNVFYIGDGSSDYNAARTASHCFAISGSRLENMCRREDIDFMSIQDFLDIEKLI